MNRCFGKVAIHPTTDFVGRGFSRTLLYKKKKVFVHKLMVKEKVRGMTREDAIKELKIQFVGEYDRQREAKDMAIKALEQIPKLQNRCYALTHGLMCVFCPYECEHRAEGEVTE